MVDNRIHIIHHDNGDRYNESVTHILLENNLCWVVEYFERHDYCCFYKLELSDEIEGDEWYPFDKHEDYGNQWLAVVHPYTHYHPLAFTDREEYSREDWVQATKDPKVALTLHLI